MRVDQIRSDHHIKFRPHKTTFPIVEVKLRQDKTMGRIEGGGVGATVVTAPKGSSKFLHSFLPSFEILILTVAGF